MTTEDYIKQKGPLLSSQLIKYYEDGSTGKDAIRKRLERLPKSIGRIRGFFKDNQTFFYYKEQQFTERYFYALIESLKTSAKQHYCIINSLQYHKGYVKKDKLASYSFSPIENLKSHKNFSNVVRDLSRIGLIIEEEDYYTLSPNISSSNKSAYKAIEIVKKNILSHFYDLNRNIGFISYNGGNFNSEFSKFQFSFTAPSYICGLSKPSFVLADIMIGGSNDEENINFFLTKINTIKKTHKKSNFIPYLITDSLSNEAFSKLKENGIVIGLIDKLFGREYKELMESLIDVITNISVILKKEPNKFIEIIKKFDKLIDGKTNNLRGDLFEFIVGYYHSNLCQSIDIGKIYKDDGKKKEVDVYASYQDKIILCECKAYKTPISLDIIEKWNEKIAFIYKVIEKNRSFTSDKNRDIIFEFWSISGFSEEATQYLQEKKNNLKKYKIEFYKRDEILKKAKDSNANKITDIMNEYFANDGI